MVAATTWNPGRMLHIARRDAGFSQQDVATALSARLSHKVSRPLVSKWERNLSYPTIEQWYELVLVFEERGVSDLRSLLSGWFTAADLDPHFVAA